MSVLDDKFAEHRPKIDALCKDDKVIREIIGDYEELSRLLGAGPSVDQIAHMRSSLAGLEEEIMAYLATLPERAEKPQNE
ncbi:hypothetical protein [Ruegeria meonggei]|uniref:hypothetical protein n=1 Tax=Ruegeria meonggei TaxID=1446476 RepID=UPI00366A7828